MVRWPQGVSPTAVCDGSVRLLFGSMVNMRRWCSFQQTLMRQWWYARQGDIRFCTPVARSTLPLVLPFPPFFHTWAPTPPIEANNQHHSADRQSPEKCPRNQGRTSVYCRHTYPSSRQPHQVCGLSRVCLTPSSWVEESIPSVVASARAVISVWKGGGKTPALLKTAA
jgi:hypothetical protein